MRRREIDLNVSRFSIREGTLEEFLIFFNLSSTLWISCK